MKFLYNDVLIFLLSVPSLSAFVPGKGTFFASKIQQSSQFHSTTIDTNVDPLGAPPDLPSIDCPSQIHQRTVFNSDGSTSQQNYDVHGISTNPPIFHLSGLLTPAEINQIGFLAGQNLHKATTTDGDSSETRTKSTVAWLNNHDLPLAMDLACDTGRLLIGDEIRNNRAMDVEPMQVIRYEDDGGRFVFHHDGCNRVLTVLYYLNGVAGTWFPLADSEDEVTDKTPRNRIEAIEKILGDSLEPGKDGVYVAGATSPLAREVEFDGNPHVVQVKPGDAVAFYSYMTENGEQKEDWRSIHAGMPTNPEEGEKWIANHWMRADPVSEN